MEREEPNAKCQMPNAKLFLFINCCIIFFCMLFASDYHCVKAALPDLLTFYGVSIQGTEWKLTNKFVLKKDNGTPYIEADTRDYPDWEIHGSFRGEIYYKIDYFNMSSSKVLTSQMNGDLSVTAYGEMTPNQVAQEWNKDNTVQYGSIIRSFSAEPSRTWVNFPDGSEQKASLVNGYAYYEITKSGYKALSIQKLTFNPVITDTKKQPTEQEGTKLLEQSVNENGFDDVKLDKVLEWPDTTTAGNKEAKIRVKQQLETNSQYVEYEYKVPVQVRPVLTEQYLNEEGSEIQSAQDTVFDIGQKYTPIPPQYINDKDQLYVYKGYFMANDPLKEEMPQAIDQSQNYKYVYQKAENLIKITFPVEMVFGSYKTQAIESPTYQLKNEGINIEPHFESFKATKTSAIKLLSKDEADPTNETPAARLHLQIGTEQIANLTDQTPEQTLKVMSKDTQWPIKITGHYFGDMQKSYPTEHELVLKFIPTK